MRHISRLPKPNVLSQKGEQWQSQYDLNLTRNPHARPEASKYGHVEIRNTLRACSHDKCFYCERKLEAGEEEVDHYIEVAINTDSAYVWDNLYLSCKDCNKKKINHTRIPVEEVLDPCHSTNEEIQNNIVFEDECILSKANSQKGIKTIDKYRLNSPLLNLKRSKWLNKINKDYIEIRKRMDIERRTIFTEQEKEKILRYMQPDQPYSLMSENYIRKNFETLFESDTCN